MAIACSNLLPNLGIHCHQASDRVLHICTPVNFPDQTPVYLFLVEQEDGYLLTDDGDTLMHLRGVGLFENPRLENSIAKRASLYGLSFEDGKIQCKTGTEGLQKMFSQYLQVMLEVIKFEREIQSIDDSRAIRIAELVAIIERRNPSDEIKRDVKIKGLSGNDYLYPLMVQDTPIDIVTPNHQSTGSVLRRAADIEKGGALDPLIIIDDSQDLNRAQKERIMISSLCRTTLLSELQHGNSPISFQA